jgi:hypothetical protein
MGGLALKSVETRRINREEFDVISNELVTVLKTTFSNVGIPLFYKNKPTFGDIDILVTQNEFGPDMRKYIEYHFSPNEIFHNGNCWSFDYKGVQIDLITTSTLDFPTNMIYFSYNDLGNLVGRLAHGFGLRYGQEGLWYEHYFKGQNVGKIPVSTNYSKTLSFLGLSYERYTKGFDELVDIFEFIASSPYFNWKRYQLVELNKINRDRNKKRSSYIAFLDWVEENVADEEHEFQFSEDKSRYLERINLFFPEAELETNIRRLEYLECKKLYVKAKFNGGDVMKKYGFSGKELGDKITSFKTYINNIFDNQDYDDFIINNDTSMIYKFFDEYLILHNNENERNT